MRPHEQKIIDAVLYAVNNGCFFPVPYPPETKRQWTTRDMVQWGAMRHLHTAIAEYSRARLQQERP